MAVLLLALAALYLATLLSTRGVLSAPHANSAAATFKHYQDTEGLQVSEQQNGVRNATTSMAEGWLGARGDYLAVNPDAALPNQGRDEGGVRGR